MNILFIHSLDIGFPGGGEVWISEVATKLKERGHNVCILYAKYNPLHRSTNLSKKLEEYGIELSVCGHIRLIKGFPILDPLTLSKRLTNHEIAYFMACPPNEIIVSLLRSVRKIPIIAGFHAMINSEDFILHRLYSPLYFKIYRNLDALHVLNKWTYVTFVKRYHVESRKVFLIPNGINTSSYSIEDNPEGKFIVLFTGRLEINKGVDTLCKIISKFNSIHPGCMSDVEFVIAGTGTYRGVMKQLSKHYNNVRYLGFVDRGDLRKVYAQSNVYLIPSRSEVMPLGALEAMASGLPIIGSDIPGLRDLVSNENLGKLVKVYEVNQFCKAIIHYYTIWKQSSKDYTKLREIIRSHAIKNYDWNEIIVRLEKMFYQVSKEI